MWTIGETALAQGLSDFFPLFLKSTKREVCAALQRPGFAYGHCHNVEDVLRIIFASRLAVRPPQYRVDEAGWSSFESYLSLASSGLANAKASRNARPVITASRRYLQATFATGDVFPQWETKSLVIEDPKSHEQLVKTQEDGRTDVLEDAVLHYVFALEALLTGDTKEAIGEKIAMSAALLIGRDDNEAMTVRSLVKKHYDRRSELVHGRELRAAVDVSKLRRVCQRVLIVVLCCYAEQPALNIVELLHELPLSHERQRQVAITRERILSLLGDSSSLSE